MSALSLLGLGHHHPPTVLDNTFLEDLDIGTTDAWIQERTGINERRTVLPLDYIRDTLNADPREGERAATLDTADAGAAAVQMALDRAGLTAADVGMLIAGGCCPGYGIPPEACRIAARLGVEAPAFDVNSACSSFGAQLHLLASMAPSGLPDAIVIVQPEHTTRVVDYRDRNTAVLWGDGTAAAVVSPSVRGRARIEGTVLGSQPSGWGKVTIPRLGHFAQQGRAVQAFAIRRTRTLVADGARRTGVDLASVNFVGHQANALMLEAVCQGLDIPEDRHRSNVSTFGNTGASGAPAVLSQHWDEWKPGDAVVVAVVGSGLTWAGFLLTFGGEP